jgi:hypothetical protein
VVYDLGLVCGSRSVAGIKLTERILVWRSGFIALGPYASVRNHILWNIIVGGDYINIIEVYMYGMLENSETIHKICNNNVMESRKLF